MHLSGTEQAITAWPMVYVSFRLGKMLLRPRTLKEKYPRQDYTREGKVITGGLYSLNPMTGEVGYERYTFRDPTLAARVCAWLNNAQDHRSFAAVCWQWEQDQAEKERLRREKEEADLQHARENYRVCDCADCDDYLETIRYQNKQMKMALLSYRHCDTGYRRKSLKDGLVNRWA